MDGLTWGLLAKALLCSGLHLVVPQGGILTPAEQLGSPSPLSLHLPFPGLGVPLPAFFMWPWPCRMQIRHCLLESLGVWDRRLDPWILITLCYYY